MRTPFTSDQFFEVFKNYNEKVFPMQGLLFMLALIVVYNVFKVSTNSDRIIALILSFFWLWMGTVYHLIFFSAINKAAFAFGTMFIIHGTLLLYLGIVQKKLSFEFHPNIYGVSGVVLISYALIIYPVVGYFLGHTYPASPTFGLPCPTTIFTFGVLLLSTSKIPISILIIPGIWSIIGFTAAFKFGVIEDTGLIIAAIGTIPMSLIRNRNKNMS